MNNKILIAASVGLSLFAAAQSKTDQQKPKPTTTQTQRPKPSDHVSARSTDQKAEGGGVIHRDLAARDVATSQASGNKSAHDDCRAWPKAT